MNYNKKRNSWYNQNSQDRTSLNSNTTYPKTIRIKALYPDYDTFKSNLAQYNFDPLTLTELQFNNVLNMCGNSYSKFSTNNKNYAYFAWIIKKYYGMYQRQKKLYDLEFDNLLISKGNNTTTNFLGSNKIDGTFSDNHTTSKQENSGSQTGNIADRYEIIKQNIDMVDPEITYVEQLSKEIVMSLPSGQDGDLW